MNARVSRFAEGRRRQREAEELPSYVARPPQPSPPQMYDHHHHPPPHSGNNSYGYGYHQYHQQQQQQQYQAPPPPQPRMSTYHQKLQQQYGKPVPSPVPRSVVSPAVNRTDHQRQVNPAAGFVEPPRNVINARPIEPVEPVQQHHQRQQEEYLPPYNSQQQQQQPSTELVRDGGGDFNEPGKKRSSYKKYNAPKAPERINSRYTLESKLKGEDKNVVAAKSEFENRKGSSILEEAFWDNQDKRLESLSGEGAHTGPDGWEQHRGRTSSSLSNAIEDAQRNQGIKRLREDSSLKRQQQQEMIQNEQEWIANVKRRNQRSRAEIEQECRVHWGDVHGIKIEKEIAELDRAVGKSRFRPTAQTLERITHTIRTYREEQRIGTREMAIRFYKAGIKYIWFLPGSGTVFGNESMYLDRCGKGARSVSDVINMLPDDY